MFRKNIFSLIFIVVLFISSCGDSNNTSVDNRCFQNSDCSDNIENKNYCNLNTNECVNCFYDLHCNSWEECSDENNCELKEDSCNNDNDCLEDKKCYNHVCAQECIDNYEEKCFENDVYYFDSCGNKQELKTDCTQEQICENGVCIDNCTPHAEEKCFEDDVYYFDSCGNRQELKTDCAQEQICENGTCNEACTPNAEEKCFENDVYYFDSCGNRQDLETECTQEQICENGICNNKVDWYYSGDAPETWEGTIEHTQNISAGDNMSGNGYFFTDTDNNDWYRFYLSNNSNVSNLDVTMINPQNSNYKLTMDFHCGDDSAVTLNSNNYGSCQAINNFMECYPSVISNVLSIETSFTCNSGSLSSVIYIIVNNNNNFSYDNYHLTVSIAD